MQVKILQFPMLAGYVCSVDGSQSCLYLLVWIDMATLFAVAHAYVALSRARSLQRLYVFNYRHEAFLVDSYYVQLWNWFVAKNVLAPKPVLHIPPYHVECSHPLSLLGSCVYAAHGTPNLISPKIWMPRF